MGTGTILVIFVLAAYTINIMKIKPFNRKKRMMLYGLVLFALSLSLLVSFQANLGFIIHSLNQTIGSMVKMVVK